MMQLKIMLSNIFQPFIELNAKAIYVHIMHEIASLSRIKYKFIKCNTIIHVASVDIYVHTCTVYMYV